MLCVRFSFVNLCRLHSSRKFQPVYGAAYEIVYLLKLKSMPALVKAMKSYCVNRKPNKRWYDVYIYFTDGGTEKIPMRTVTPSEESQLAPELRSTNYFCKFELPISREEVMSFLQGGASLPSTTIKLTSNDGGHYSDGAMRPDSVSGAGDRGYGDRVGDHGGGGFVDRGGNDGKADGGKGGGKADGGKGGGKADGGKGGKQ
jgi:hypothetical protein